MKQTSRFKWVKVPSLLFMDSTHEYFPTSTRCTPLLPEEMQNPPMNPNDLLAHRWLESCSIRYYLACYLAVYRRFPAKSMKAALKQMPKFALDTTQPLCEYLGSLLDLCIECHAVESRFSNHYQSASDWFKRVFSELLQHELSVSAVYMPGGMTEEVKQMRREIACLKDLDYGSNPYSQSDRPHLWRLMEDARRQANENDRFRDNFFIGRQRSRKKTEFKPFIAAFRELATDMEQNWTTSWIEDGRIVRQVGRGRTVEYLPPPPSLKVLMQKVELETPM